jgi:hypothetical protein
MDPAGELFNEINRWVSGKKKVDASMAAAKRRYEIVRDFLKAPRRCGARPGAALLT